jgi:hypothetical protein
MHDRFGNGSWIAFMTKSILQGAQLHNLPNVVPVVIWHDASHGMKLDSVRGASHRSRLFSSSLTIGGTFSIVFANR